jgi:hypothetical protein
MDNYKTPLQHRNEAVKRHDKFVKGIVAVWIASFVLGLSVLGVVIWAVIRLVNHFT